MSKSLPNIVLALAVVLLIAAFAFQYPTLAGSLETNAPAPSDTYREYQFFASSTAPSTIATTTSATSTQIASFFDTSGRLDNGSFEITGAEEVLVFFSRGDTSGEGNTGSSNFKIQATPDGTNWYDYNDLQNITSERFTSALVDARVGSSTIAAATSTTMYRLDAKAFKAIRCIVVETTDGEHACAASARF